MRDRIEALTGEVLGTPADDVVIAGPGTVLKTSADKHPCEKCGFHNFVPRLVSDYLIFEPAGAGGITAVVLTEVGSGPGGGSMTSIRTTLPPQQRMPSPKGVPAPPLISFRAPKARPGSVGTPVQPSTSSFPVALAAPLAVSAAPAPRPFSSARSRPRPSTACGGG